MSNDAFAFNAPEESFVKILSASKFAREIKRPGTEVFFGLLESESASLNFTHRAAHGDKAETVSGGLRSEEELDYL